MALHNLRVLSFAFFVRSDHRFLLVVRILFSRFVDTVVYCNLQFLLVPMIDIVSCSRFYLFDSVKETVGGVA